MAKGNTLRRIYLVASTLFPPALVARAERVLEQGGTPPAATRPYLGFSLFLAIAVGLVAFFISPFFLKLQFELFIVIGVAAFVIALAMIYSYLINRAESRAEQIETLLPDALQIISANIRAGMTLESAFWTAARPEFGPLRDEIKKVSAQTMGGRPFRDSLEDVGTRVRSTILERAIRLIVEGIALGGEMASLLEEVAKDIRNTQLLRKEITTQTMMYTIFIVFAGVLISPLLFSVALYYGEVNERIEARTAAATKDIPTGGAGAGVPSTPFSAGPRTRSPDRITSADINSFAVACIVITNFFAALLLGGIRTGKRTSGLKYVLLFIIISMFLFTSAHGVLATTLGAFSK